MDFKSLHYPLAVAECKSISKAAAQLGITQPSLSKYIQSLNGSLGVELFELNGQELAPTYAGERYLLWAQKIVPLTSNLARIRPFDFGTSIRVACAKCTDFYVNPFASRQFMETNVNIQLSLDEVEDPVREVRDGTANIAIVGIWQDDDQLSCEHLATDEIVLVASQTHPISNHAVWKEGCRHPWVNAELLRNETLVQLHMASPCQRIADVFLTENDIILYPTMRTGIHQALQIAATGAAVCLVPEQAARFFSASRNTVRYSLGAPLQMELFSVYDKDAANASYIESYLNLIKSFLA